MRFRVFADEEKPQLAQRDLGRGFGVEVKEVMMLGRFRLFSRMSLDNLAVAGVNRARPEGFAMVSSRVGGTLVQNVGA